MKHKSEFHDALFVQAYSLSLVVNKIALRDTCEDCFIQV